MDITQILIKVIDSEIGIAAGSYRVSLFADDEFTLDHVDRKLEGPKPSMHILGVCFWLIFGKLEITSQL